MTCCFFSIGSSQGSEGFEGGAKLAILLLCLLQRCEHEGKRTGDMVLQNRLEAVDEPLPNILQ